MDRIIQIIIMLNILVFPLTSYSVNNYQSNQQKEDGKTEEDNNQKDKESNLNLPDVIIYGEERSVRRTGRKLKVKRENVKLLDIDVEYPSSIYEKKLAQTKLLLFEQGQRSQITNMATFQFGSFNTPYLMIERSQETDHYDYRVSGEYHHSDGQFDNSQFSIGETNLHLNLNVTPEFKASLDGDVYYSKYGLHGANIENLERKLTFGNAKLSSQWTISSNSSASVNILLRQINTSDKTSEVQHKCKLDEQTVGVSGNFKTKIAAYLLSLNTDYLHNDYSGQEYFNIGAGLSLPLSTLFSLNSTVIIEKVTSQNERLSPSVKLIFTPNRRLGLSIKGRRYFKPLFFYELWKQNNYIASEINIVPENIKFHFAFDVEYKILNQLIMNAKITREWIEDYSYWQKNIDSGLFELNQLSDVAITELSWGVQYNFSDRLSITSQVSYFIDDVDDTPLSSQNLTIPYLEDFRFKTQIQALLPESISCNLSSSYVGQRYTTLTKDNELDNFFFISISVKKQINSYLNIFIGSNNLLDDKYELWQDYREMGFRFFFGLEGKW